MVRYSNMIYSRCIIVVLENLPVETSSVEMYLIVNFFVIVWSQEKCEDTYILSSSSIGTEKVYMKDNLLSACSRH